MIHFLQDWWRGQRQAVRPDGRGVIALIDTHEILAIREAVLRLALERDPDSTVLMAALADVVGITAAVLHQSGGAHQRVGIDARLESFCDRAREQYHRTRRDMMDHRLVSQAVANGLLRT